MYDLARVSVTLFKARRVRRLRLLLLDMHATKSVIESSIERQQYAKTATYKARQQHYRTIHESLIWNEVQPISPC